MNNLNTSHVKVKHLATILADNTTNLNTSHVKVKLKAELKIKKYYNNLNTSHVKVKPVNHSDISQA